jgi:hypothetical protein
VPKSSMERVTPSSLQVFQRRGRRLAVLDHRVLGELDVEHRRVDAGILEDPLDHQLDAALAELHGAEIDRELHAQEPLLTPDPVLGAGGLQHPGGQGGDEPDILGEPDELARPDDAAMRVVPADQRLHADDPPAVELDLRLVVDEELVAGQGLAELALEGHRAPGGEVHLGREEAIGVAARGLGPVHREIGVLQERPHGLAVGRKKRDADRGRDVHLLLVDDEGLGEGVAQAPGELGRIVDPAKRRLEDDELVGAEPGDAVGLAQAPGETAGHGAQQAVAEAVAEGLVDALEAVEIDDQDGQLLVLPPGAGELLLGPVLEGGGGDQAGQRIGAAAGRGDRDRA